MKKGVLISVDEELLGVSQTFALKVRKRDNYSEYIQRLIERGLEDISMMDSDSMKTLGINVREFLDKKKKDL